MDITTLVIAACIPSGVTGFCFWLLERSIRKKDAKEQAKKEQQLKQEEEHEKVREENLFMLLQSVNASIALGEATAKAVQRIPDAHCNGDMHEALDYATRIKHRQKEFLTKQGIQNIYVD